MLLPLAVAHAASLDNLEIGGPWGTPTVNDATAVWWNPAGIAAGEGTRIQLEGAPTFATVTQERAAPHGGSDIYTLQGVVPYAGVVSDLGVDGLGVGLGLAIPFVRGGAETTEPGPGAFHMRDGDSRAIFAMLGAGYEIADRVAIGVGLALVRSSWTARVDTDTLPSLDAAIAAQGEDAGYTDAMLEDPEYTGTLQFGELSDTTFTFSAGARVKPVEGLVIGVAYIHGAAVDNTGDVTIALGCPPETDTVGRFGAERAGVCDATVHADASVAYVLPNRIHAGVAYSPADAVTLEAMGGWVHWSVFTDFDIGVHGSDLDNEEGRAMIEQDRLWARANEDSAWFGLDAKGRLGERWTFGGRVLYDTAAVPDIALSSNNYDADAVMLSGLVAYAPTKTLQFGVSWTHHFLQEREVTDSGFSMTVDGEPTEDRWNYPHANGVYNGTIDRVGIAARAAF